MGKIRSSLDFEVKIEISEVVDHKICGEDSGEGQEGDDGEDGEEVIDHLLLQHSVKYAQSDFNEMLAEMKSALAIEPKDYSENGEGKDEGSDSGYSSGTVQSPQRGGEGRNGSPVVKGQGTGNSLTPEKYSKGRKCGGRQQSCSVNGKNKNARPPLVDIGANGQESALQMDVFEQFAKIQINEDFHGYFFYFAKFI